MNSKTDETSQHMMNETRTARVIAVIAGNAFFLNKIADVWLSSQGRFHLEVGAVTLALVALLGISLSYISLFGRSEKRWPLALELVSALGFLTNALWWLYWSRYGSTY